MEITFFIILSLMFTIYLILDGVDFGVGIIHLFLSKTEKEKNNLEESIGPFWDGNEVWLIAGGGVLFMAFPKLYAVAFSGFYLPLMLLLWLLIFRGLGLELKHFLDHPLWNTIWNKAFGISSILLALIFGITLGNIIRGVHFNPEQSLMPLDQHQFFVSFFNYKFSPFLENKGVIDWFTLLFGILAIIILTIHGGTWVLYKTNMPLNKRIRKLLPKLIIISIPLIIISNIAWAIIKTDAFSNYISYPILFIIPIITFFFYFKIYKNINNNLDYKPFMYSSLFLAFAMISTAVSLFPTLLYSTNPKIKSLTLFNSAASPEGLRTAISWWPFAFILALIYFAFIHYVMRGKIVDTKRSL